MFDFNKYFSKYEGLSKAKLTNIELIKENNLIKFNLSSENIINLQEIDYLVSEIKSHYSDMFEVDFSIIYDFKEKDNNFYKILKLNIDYFIKRISLISYKCCQTTIDNSDIIIEASTDSTYEQIKEQGVDKKLKDFLLNLYGLDFNIRIRIEETAADSIEEKNQELLEYEIKKSISENSTKNDKKVSEQANNNQIFKKEKQAPRFKPNIKDEKKFDVLELTKISEINDNSGEVHIKGTVVAFEKRELKSGN